MPTSRVPSDVAFSHADYERLVTGRSLKALEPEDDERLSAHLPVCSVCQRALALLQEVAAELARIVRAVDPPPALWETLVGCWEGTSGTALAARVGWRAARGPGESMSSP